MPADVGYKIVTLENGTQVAYPGDLDDASIHAHMTKMANREAVTAPAVRGAQQRNTQPNEMGPGGDPRLQASQQINMERATAAGAAMAPIAGVAMGAPMIGAGARAIGATALAHPAVSGALATGIAGLLQGHGLQGSIVDAALGATGGSVVNAGVKGALKLVASRGARAVAPAAEQAIASAAPKVAQMATGAAPAVEAAAAKQFDPAMVKIAEDVLKWKSVNKFSDAQVISSLRNVHGISPKIGKDIMKLLASGGD